MSKIAVTITTISLFLLALLISSPSHAQKRGKQQQNTTQQAGFDEDLYSSVKWRSIGPYRGGRSAAVTGVPGKPNLYYNTDFEPIPHP